MITERSCAKTEPEREHNVVTREKVLIHLQFWRHVLCQRLFCRRSRSCTRFWEFSDPVVCENFSESHWMNRNIQGHQVHTVPGKMTCQKYFELVGRRTCRRSICLHLLFVSPGSCSRSPLCRHRVDSGLILCVHVTTWRISVGWTSSWCGFIKPKHSGPLQADCVHSITESGNQRRSEETRPG